MCHACRAKHVLSNLIASQFLPPIIPFPCYSPSLAHHTLSFTSLLFVCPVQSRKWPQFVNVKKKIMSGLRGDILTALWNHGQYEALLLIFQCLKACDLVKCTVINKNWLSLITSLVAPKLSDHQRTIIKWVHSSRFLRLTALPRCKKSERIQVDSNYIYWLKRSRLVIYKNGKRMAAIEGRYSDIISTDNFFVLKSFKEKCKVLVVQKLFPEKVWHVKNFIEHEHVELHNPAENIAIVTLGPLLHQQVILQLHPSAGKFLPLCTVNLPWVHDLHYGLFSQSFAKSQFVTEVEWPGRGKTVIIYDGQDNDIIWSYGAANHSSWYFPFNSVTYGGVIIFHEDGLAVIRYMWLANKTLQRYELQVDNCNPEAPIHRMGLFAKARGDYLITYTISKRYRKRHWKHVLNIFDLCKQTHSCITLLPSQKTSSSFEYSFEIVNQDILVVKSNKTSQVIIYDLSSDPLKLSKSCIEFVQPNHEGQVDFLEGRLYDVNNLLSTNVAEGRSEQCRMALVNLGFMNEQ